MRLLRMAEPDVHLVRSQTAAEQLDNCAGLGRGCASVLQHLTNARLVVSRRLPELVTQSHHGSRLFVRYGASIAKKALELALREALVLGDNCIGSEHILLGLVRVHDGLAARILLDFDADLETIRRDLIRLLAVPNDRRRDAGGPEPST
jgi:hypothetical protein